jgi:transitional endoplasmic reticulum ATPase
MANGFSGAEIEDVCNRAALQGIKRFVEKNEKSVKTIKITQQDLVDAVDKVRPRKKEAPLSQSIK